MRDASTGRSETTLPSPSGHHVAPGFENFAKAPGRRVIVNVKFDCYYAGSPLFEAHYRLHYFP